MCHFVFLFLCYRDSKLAEDIEDDLEEQAQHQPRTRAEEDAHRAYLAQKASEKRE